MQDANRTIGKTNRGRRDGYRAEITGWSSRAIRGLMLAAACVSPCAASDVRGNPAAGSSETVVRLYRVAMVAGDEVTLADIAEVQGDSAELIARRPLMAAPHAGDSGVIELAQLQNMLARRGANLSQWIFRGSSRCTVTRIGQKTEVAPPGTVHPHAASQPAAGSIENAGPQPVDPNTLEAALRDHIGQRLARLGGVPIVRFSPGVSRVLTLSKPTYDFQVTDRSERLLGMVPLEVTVLEKGQARQTLPVLCDVSLRKSVVVAVRSLNRGGLIEPGSLILQERIFDRVDDIGLSEVQPLVGQRLKRLIDARAMVYARDIEPVPLVLRNDLVTVIVRSGGMTIRGSAKAMSSGGLNEPVLLKNEMSKETFSAIVTGQKTAELREHAAPVESAPRKSAGDPGSAAVQALAKREP